MIKKSLSKKLGAMPSNSLLRGTIASSQSGAATTSLIVPSCGPSKQHGNYAVARKASPTPLKLLAMAMEDVQRAMCERKRTAGHSWSSSSFRVPDQRDVGRGDFRTE